LSTVDIETALPASLPILKARFGTGMFWIVALAAVIPIVFLVLIRYEPTDHDIGDENAATPGAT
jgi:membrane protein CcdC involved in cytochrome C biogenesis